MEFLSKILPTIQIIVSILLIISILLQQTGAGLGAGFGGGDATIAGKSTRRGLEKFLLKFTIFLAVLFFTLSVISVYLIK